MREGEGVVDKMCEGDIAFILHKKAHTIAKNN